MNEISLGTIYEMNKNALKSMPILSYEDFKKSMKEVKDWLNTEIYDNPYDFIIGGCDNYGNYYMLLNNELHDYTVFRLGTQCPTEDREKNVEQMIYDIKECFENRYFQFVSINKGDDEYSYEIWVKREEGWSEEDSGEVYCYYLFPYDGGIIDYGRND